MSYPRAIQSVEITQAHVFRRMLALQAPPIPSWFMPLSTEDNANRCGRWPWYYADLVMSREQLTTSVVVPTVKGRATL